MPGTVKKSLHIPLPLELHEALEQQSEQLRTPVTALAKEAIEEWLMRRRTEELAEQIREHAMAAAGTADDLDEDLTAAGEDELAQVGV